MKTKPFDPAHEAQLALARGPRPAVARALANKARRQAEFIGFDRQGQPTPALQASIAKIALTHLRVETLTVRGRDHLDFTDCHVAAIRDALLAAYKLGRETS